MQRDLWSVVLACALGAFMGTFISLEIAERFEYGRYFWGLGVIVGGLIGYVSVDFRELCSGIARAYHRTIAWRPDRLYWKEFFLIYAAVSTILSNLFLVCFFVFGLRASLEILALIQVWFFVIISGVSDYNKESERLDETRKNAKSIILNTNPIAVLYWTVWVVWWLISHIPSATVVVTSATALFLVKATRVTVLFVATAFRYVHSSRRMICLTGGALGVVIGYHAGDAIIGAVVGAIIGAIERELIAIHWLKVVPNGGRA